MNWKAKLQSHGLTEETAPNLVKKVIAERVELENEAKELKNQLKSENLTDDERKEIEEALTELPDALKAIDAKILKKVEYWEKMKDTWATASERLASGRKGGRPPKNKAEKGQQVEEQIPQPPQPPAQQVVELEAEEIKPIKSGGFGKIGVFLLLGLLSFGAYNYLKNND